MTTELEQLIVRIQARKLALAYDARDLDLPVTVAKILVDDTPERNAADYDAWRQWCHDRGVEPVLHLAREDTVLVEGDPSFDSIWRGEQEGPDRGLTVD